MSVGQVILGVRDLDAAAARVEALGLHVLDGGVHPGLGTANRVVPLGESYLELLGVLDQAEAGGNDYGRALLGGIEHGDRFVRWSIRTERIEADAARLGLVVEHRQRLRPDGSLLTWQAAGLELAYDNPWLPFFMQWDDPAQFPGSTPVSHPLGTCTLAWVEIAAPYPERLATWTEGAGPLPLHTVAGPAGIAAIAIATPEGELVIRP